MKIVVGISGASCSMLGIRLISHLSKNNDVFAVITDGAKRSLMLENHINIESLINFSVQNGAKHDEFFKPNNKLKTKEIIFNANHKNITFLDDKNLGACIASGSFKTDKTIIAPCSINTLAKISNGISDTLLTRASAVALKEQKKLILGVREMPFSSISLKQMSELSKMGVCIAPPIIAMYSHAKSLDDIYDFIVGKWLDILEVNHEIYKRWK